MIPTNQDYRTTGSVRRILEHISEAVLDETVYQRVLISFYERPITFSHDSRARVLEYAARGVEPAYKKELDRFVDQGGQVSGEKYLPEFRLNNSYYIPAGRAPRSVTPWIPSRRRFINPNGWHADDLLLTPLRVEGGCIGQISVDDPRDGRRPTKEKLREL
ncbi:MAG TPA: hypothetical protein VMX15_02300, partial [Candidatus Heimdallarchaeota archaeon]|nr:hypothetical protein [Candidatus Heimdallarchaeota archaeon]